MMGMYSADVERELNAEVQKLRLEIALMRGRIGGSIALLQSINPRTSMDCVMDSLRMVIDNLKEFDSDDEKLEEDPCLDQ